MRNPQDLLLIKYIKIINYTINMGSNQLSIFHFNNNSLRVFGTIEKPMFLAKEVGEILGLVNINKNISTLNESWKDVITISDSIGRLQNQVVISEPAVYKLAFSSRKEEAQIFVNWVCEEVLPSIRRTGKYELEEAKERETELIRKLDEAKKKEERLHTIHIELLSFKKLKEKNESVYIVSNKSYAEKGIYKIGRTKCMKTRLSGHNTTHIRGDKFKVLAEFKVNNSQVVETWIHKKLTGLLVDGEREFFMCPYNLLYDIVELIVKYDEDQSEVINKIIDTVYHLKQNNYYVTDWTTGLDMSIFKDEIKLITDGKEIVNFDVSNATEEEKKEFIKGCVELYNRTIQGPEKIAGQLVWKLLQGFMIQKLSIPKYKFKVSDWKELIRDYVAENHLAIKWK